MTGRERVLAHLDGGSVDRLPLMPITMMLAADHAGVRYRDYVTDHQALAAAQVATAATFGFDHVSAISDPTREAADCGAEIQFFDDQPPAIRESSARLANKSALAGLPVPDPLGGGRMEDRVRGVAELRRRVGQDLLGNLDPVAVLRNDTAEVVTERLARCHAQAGPRSIVGAGCEIPRDTPDANVLALRDYATTHAAEHWGPG